MRLTGRGVGVLVLIVLAMLLAFVSGERSLNAVAAPLLGALGYGFVQLTWADDPTVEFAPMRPGYPGETREWSCSLGGRGVVRVIGDWPAGVDGRPIDAVVSLPGTVDAEVDLTERGVHDLDALTVRRRDALGLLEARVHLDETATATVYPRLYDVGRHEAFSALLADDIHIERQEFDRLREYEPGDPLRRIHWASSAKLDEFLVVEFAPNRQTQEVTIAADAVPGRADEMASAVGTVALLALREGLDVGVALPGERLPAGSGDAHRANLLAVLARVGDGSVPPSAHEAADVSVAAGPKGTTVRIEGTAFSFEDVLDEPETSPVREVVVA